MKEINPAELPETITIKIDTNKELKLFLTNGRNGKIHTGIGELSDIEWYEYKITNSEEIGLPYDNIALSLFAVDDATRKKAAETIVKEKITSKDTKRPNIDYNTGNIHLDITWLNDNPNKTIKQLVLCKGPGPKTTNEGNDHNFYCYKNTKREKGCYVHKACYYPLIEEDNALHNDWRYKLLESLWKELSKN